MDLLGFPELLVAVIVCAYLLPALYRWLMPKIGPRLGIPIRWVPLPRNACPRCEKTALKLAYHVRDSYPRPTPDYFFCTDCGARWSRLFNRPWEDASDPKHDWFFGPEVPYSCRGEADNGNEVMEVVPFEPGWVKCPHCGWKFSPRKNLRPGWKFKHTSCGQRLVIKDDLDRKVIPTLIGE